VHVHTDCPLVPSQAAFASWRLQGWISHGAWPGAFEQVVPVQSLLHAQAKAVAVLPVGVHVPCLELPQGVRPPTAAHGLAQRWKGGRTSGVQISLAAQGLASQDKVSASQVFPPQWPVQLHVKLVPASRHFPPFLQESAKPPFGFGVLHLLAVWQLPPMKPEPTPQLQE
jgi:hypothetical protein